MRQALIDSLHTAVHLTLTTPSELCPIMISAFLVRKPISSTIKEEPQLVSARAGWGGTQAQTGRLQGALMHLLCIKRLSYMSDAECCLPTWLCGCYPLECQVLHELDLSYYIMSSFLVQEATGKEALMNFQGQLQFI